MLSITETSAARQADHVLLQMLGLVLEVLFGLVSLKVSQHVVVVIDFRLHTAVVKVDMNFVFKFFKIPPAKLTDHIRALNVWQVVIILPGYLKVLQLVFLQNVSLQGSLLRVLLTAVRLQTPVRTDRVIF